MQSPAGVLKLVLVALLLGGCAADDLMVKRQAESEARLERLQQSTATADVRLNQLAERLARLEEKEQQQAGLVLAMGAQLAELKGHSRSVQAPQPESGTVATPRIELVNPVSVAKGKDAGPPPAYLHAFGLYSSNAFPAAIEAFERFLGGQPGSEYVPNAHYWIGECYYSSTDLPKALTAFQKVVDGWPQHPKASDALLKMGYSYAALKQPEQATAVFERLIRSYPGSQAALKARERLLSQ